MVAVAVAGVATGLLKICITVGHTTLILSTASIAIVAGLVALHFPRITTAAVLPWIALREVNFCGSIFDDLPSTGLILGCLVGAPFGWISRYFAVSRPWLPITPDPSKPNEFRG